MRYSFFLLTIGIFITLHGISLKNPFHSCNDVPVICVDGDAPAIPPEQSVWKNSTELNKLPAKTPAKAESKGITCQIAEDTNTVCQTKWKGSHAYSSKDSGFLNQIYVKMPGSITYTLKTEPIASDAYDALKAAYIDPITAAARRLMPGEATQQLSNVYGALQKQKDPKKTTEHIDTLLKAFGYSWNGTKATITDPEKVAYAQALGVDPNEWLVPSGGYQSFNDFFTHTLKDGSRSVEGTNSADVVSPADSKLTILENVSGAITVFKVKQNDFTLENFLGDKSLASTFDGGTLMIFRLSPYNYHRFHTPVDGIPLQSKFIKTTGLESVDPIAYKTGIDPLIINKRERIPIDTPFGKIIVVVVGAYNVGTIINTYKPCVFQTKGEELGYFSYGGSTLVVVFEKGALSSIDPEILKHSQAGYETAIKMGEKVAKFSQDKFNTTWDHKTIMETCEKSKTK